MWFASRYFLLSIQYFDNFSRCMMGQMPQCIFRVEFFARKGKSKSKNESSTSPASPFPFDTT